MTDRPILFSAPMVRALLEGRKTQTRRVLKPIAGLTLDALVRDGEHSTEGGILGGGVYRCARHQVQEPRFAPGDRLWVKETWNLFSFSQDGEAAWPLSTIPTREEFEEVRELTVRGDWQIIYRESDRARQWFADQKWRVSIHMPRWASRLTLLVTDVRVGRLQDISEADALAEGIVPALEGFALTPAGECWRPTAAASYATLWDSINGPDAWNENPWVVAVTFTVEQRNIDK